MTTSVVIANEATALDAQRADAGIRTVSVAEPHGEKVAADEPGPAEETRNAQTETSRGRIRRAWETMARKTARVAPAPAVNRRPDERGDVTPPLVIAGMTAPKTGGRAAIAHVPGTAETPLTRVAPPRAGAREVHGVTRDPHGTATGPTDLLLAVALIEERRDATRRPTRQIRNPDGTGHRRTLREAAAAPVGGVTVSATVAGTALPDAGEMHLQTAAEGPRQAVGVMRPPVVGVMRPPGVNGMASPVVGEMHLQTAAEGPRQAVGVMRPPGVDAMASPVAGATGPRTEVGGLPPAGNATSPPTEVERTRPIVVATQHQVGPGPETTAEGSARSEGRPLGATIVLDPPVGRIVTRAAATVAGATTLRRVRATVTSLVKTFDLPCVHELTNLPCPRT